MVRDACEWELLCRIPTAVSSDWPLELLALSFSSAFGGTGRQQTTQDTTKTSKITDTKRLALLTLFICLETLHYILGCKDAKFSISWSIFHNGLDLAVAECSKCVTSNSVLWRHTSNSQDCLPSGAVLLWPKTAWLSLWADYLNEV